jgi:SNF family Na+-dependent transporter
MLTYAFLILYLITAVLAFVYTTSEILAYIFDPKGELKTHRLTHIWILILLILFNGSLILTDTNRGVDDFLHTLDNTVVVAYQYLFMSIFTLVAGWHLRDEIEDIKKKNE